VHQIWFSDEADLTVVPTPMVRELAIGAGASAAVADRIAPQIMVLLSGALIVRQTANQRDSARVARATAELLLEQIQAGRA